MASRILLVIDGDTCTGVRPQGWWTVCAETGAAYRCAAVLQPQAVLLCGLRAKPLLTTISTLRELLPRAGIVVIGVPGTPEGRRAVQCGAQYHGTPASAAALARIIEAAVISAASSRRPGPPPARLH